MNWKHYCAEVIEACYVCQPQTGTNRAWMNQQFSKPTRPSISFADRLTGSTAEPSKKKQIERESVRAQTLHDATIVAIREWKNYKK